MPDTQNNGTLLSPDVISLAIAFINLAVVLAPELIKDGHKIINLLTSSGDISESEMSQIRKDLDESFRLLQEAIEAKLKEAPTE